MFEVGAGTGTLTHRLLNLGASPLFAVEPDPRMAKHLQDTHDLPELQVRVARFEDVDLPKGRFDLGVSATAFHWVDQAAGLAKARELLKPLGWWAMVWNVFGDPARHDAFHEATTGLLAGTGAGPSTGLAGVPFALDEARRSGDLAAAGFRDIRYDRWDWTLVLTPAQVRGLYGTYSDINAMPSEARERLLDDLVEIAERQFAGRVERNMVTALYTARR